MASDKITERNRQNAQNSTGPRTAEGKAKSSRNALKHGFTSTMMSSKEDRHELNILDKELRRDLQPDTRLEGEVLDRITWAVHQGNKLKIQLCDSERLLLAHLHEEATEPDAPDCTKLAVVRDHTPELFKQVDLLRRYARDADRDFDRSARTFVFLQSNRKKELRLQTSWEREEERKEKNSRPDTYSSAYHSMTRKYLEERGIDPSPHAALEREAQRNYDKRMHEEKLLKEKQYREELEAYLDPIDAEDEPIETSPDTPRNEPTKTPPKR